MLEALLFVVLAASSLTAALLTWRGLARAGSGLRQAQDRISARTDELSESASATRDRLAAICSESERALWALANADARLESAEANLRAKRAGSDRLRASMARNEATLARIRSGARLLLRAIQTRREFLG